MAVEMVKVEEDWTVARAIREIRAQASDVENIYTIYMVDDQGRLNGRLVPQEPLAQCVLRTVHFEGPERR